MLIHSVTLYVNKTFINKRLQRPCATVLIITDIIAYNQYLVNIICLPTKYMNVYRDY